jgi:hypothetical protein
MTKERTSQAMLTGVLAVPQPLKNSSISSGVEWISFTNDAVPNGRECDILRRQRDRIWMIIHLRWMFLARCVPSRANSDPIGK